MLKVLKLRNRLLGRALAVFLGVAAVSSLVFALSFVFKRDLDQVHERLHALNEQEFDLQITFSLANDLLLDLAAPHGDGGPGEAAIVDWRSRLKDLADMKGEGSFDTRTSPNYASVQEVLIDVEEVLANPLSVEYADELAARLIPTLRGFSAEVESALKRAQEASLQLIREDERKAGFGTLVMLCVGFAGFTVVCLLTGRFFLQLSRDVGRLKEHAERIAEGDCGEPLSLERKDEVGELAQALNAMARALAERAKQIENARHLLFQGEKMFALGTFAAGIAHELANRSHSVMVICEQVGGSLAKGPSERNAAGDRKRLQTVVEQLGRMSSALRDLSDLAGPAPVEMEAMSVNSVLESAIRLLHFDPRFPGIRLTANLSRDVQMVYGAPSQLTQVAINILINAVEAIEGEDGTIVVTSSPDRDGVLITIEDNGHGMSKETREKALDAFFTTKRRGEESGLGLAVCKAIVDEHRGSLAIESEPGRGTRVQIGIPSMPQEGTP